MPDRRTEFRDVVCTDFGADRFILNPKAVFERVCVESAEAMTM